MMLAKIIYLSRKSDLVAPTSIYVAHDDSTLTLIPNE